MPEVLTLPQSLAINGLLFTALCLLVAYLWKRTDKRIEAMEAKLETGQLAQFQAFDKEREKHWTIWRDELTNRIDDYMDGQAKWRHEELAPLLRQFGSDIDRLGEQVRGIDRRVTLLEDKR